MNHVIDRFRNAIASRTILTLACAATATLLVGCGSDTTAAPGTSPVVESPIATLGQVSGSLSSSTLADEPVAADVASTDAATPQTNGEGSPSDPCSLLSAAIAADAIGAAVGEPTRVTDQGNASCMYKSTDPSLDRFVYLTTYAVVGSPAVLAAAAATFRDAQSVSGLGDAAEISVESQAVGVLVGSQVFALGVIQQKPDGTLLLLTSDQLAAVAQAVLGGR